MKVKNGYLINLYQYAKRYRYNGQECLEFFNYTMDRRETRGNYSYSLDDEYTTFGEFDVLEIIPVDSFRKYHDVSELAKDWLGKRQSVLLYDISTEEMPVRLGYYKEERRWRIPGKQDACGSKDKRFFCLTMLSLTNEIIERTDDLLGLQKALRGRILSVVDRINQETVHRLECEVFGTFNTSEVGIVWLSDQYVDILQTVDYIKHIKVKKTGKVSEAAQDWPVFLGSFSVIAFKQGSDPETVIGDALVQVSVHDIVSDYGELKEIADDIIAEDDKGEGTVLFSVGEYDIVLHVSAHRAVRLLDATEGYLRLGKRGENKRYETEDRKILRSNIRLLYREEHTTELKKVLDEMYAGREFTLPWDHSSKEFLYGFEWRELKYSEDGVTASSNADYYNMVREELKKRVSASAGAVDTLDLMYTDYNSVISSAYSAMWVSDIHRQFKAVLKAIYMLLSSDVMGWSWDRYQDLTNAFKQQIYHLTQSNRMFFETPSCHLRATGQYDFLMHAYYGITKRILEVIYLIQGEDAQSELVPLITVNTVPQVRSQMYFEEGDSDSRTVNLDIPNTIIFDLQKGAWYLTHELFHYVAPWNRKERNYYMGIFLLTMVFKQQFLHVIQWMLSIRTDGTEDAEAKSAVLHLFAGGAGENGKGNKAEFYRDLDHKVYWFVIKYYDTDIRPYLRCADDALSSGFQTAILRFSEGASSERLFVKLLAELLPLCNIFLADDVLGRGIPDNIRRVQDRLQYCMKNLEDSRRISRFLRPYMGIRAMNHNMGKYRLAMYYWAAVREACSDIAMVSLNGMSLQDYMMTCIQAWTDSGKDVRDVLKRVREKGFEIEWLRYGLVTEYFCTKSKDGWDCYTDEDNTLVCQGTQSRFIQQYVWFYAGKNIKHPKGDYYIAERGFSNLHKNAWQWLDFFSEARHYYLKFLSFYYNILEKVLEDFDVDRRMKKVCSQGRGAYAKEVRDICGDFRKKVKMEYTALFDSMPTDVRDLLHVSEKKEDISTLDEKYKDLRFRLDISVAHFFRKQRSLKELGDLNQSVRSTVRGCASVSHSLEVISSDMSQPEEKKGRNCWKFRVHSLAELFFYIMYCTEKLNLASEGEDYRKGQHKAHSIWYRGHSSLSYSHLPTVMRYFTEEKRKRFPSLMSFQCNNFEEFKFHADGAAEMPAGQRFTKSDYIAMMQHYGVPTNFLDWSENAFTSLYFALRPYFENTCSEVPDHHDVTISMFHPGIYNHIRRESLQSIRANEGLFRELNPMLAKVLDPDIGYTALIPNLSVKENEDCFNMFLLGDIRSESHIMGTAGTYRTDLGYQENLKDLFMPMAILTSRLNPRIRTQFGCFVAFNLYTPPNPDAGGRPFGYISLEEIQGGKEEKGIFMYQIIIDKECCREVADWLKATGISQENVYPELSEKIIGLIGK